MSVTVEVAGLRLEGRHGVEEQERQSEQPFLVDLWLEVSDAALADRIEDTVDYREVVDCVQEIFAARQFHLLEALAAAVADELVERFDVERARVRVRKPAVQLTVPVDYTAATAVRGSRR